MWFYNAKGELINLATFGSIKLLPVALRWAIFGYPKHFENAAEGVQLAGELTHEEAIETMKRIAAKLDAAYEKQDKIFPTPCKYKGNSMIRLKKGSGRNNS